MMKADTFAPWAQPVLLTADDLVAISEDGWRYELVQGRLIREPPASFGHGELEMNLGAELQRFVRAHSLGLVVTGDTGFLVSRPGEPDTVLSPDLAFVAADRLWPGIPN